MSYDENFLLQSIEIAEAGSGLTAPNPIVGAVIVDKSGVILGEGFHAGLKHAEILAMDAAIANGHSLQGATLYCSLEPCNHHGKNPPCTDAIIAAGILEVYFALSDPNPVADGGAEKLLSAGIRIEGDLLKGEAAYSNRAWLTKIASGRPRITVKIAQTIDSRIAAADGRSKWITSEESRQHAKGIRDGFDAICVGTGTAVADDPTLRGATRNPRRFVIGESGLPTLSLDEQEGYTHLRTRNLHEVVANFAGLGFNSVLIEGGPALSSAFLREGLVDEVHLYVAPSIMGAGKSAVDIPEFTDFSQQLHYELTALSIVSGDIFATYIKEDYA
jgi:diaminohydroxyphosphoribosylaminopyrimidine deaminase/5-amino-6-(5-phosphoribosylamino)uracil reductase